jgi:hypothetical protein
MENIQIIEVPTINGIEQHIVIDKGNNDFVTMPKAVWDEQQSQQQSILGGN